MPPTPPSPSRRNESRPSGAKRPSGHARKGPPPGRNEKDEATQLATRSGIPFPQALLVVRGELKLNDVLNRMWLADKHARLVREGMDPSLAGQVVRGRLSAERAREIQALWQLQSGSFHSDALRVDRTARRFLLPFEGQPLVGLVVRVSRYDVAIVDANGGLSTLKKHDLKLHGPAEALAAAVGALVPDPAIRELSLKASDSLDDRFRPTEALAREWAANRKPRRFLFRDGDSLVGVPIRVALFEIEVACGDGATVCLMTHALLKDRPFQDPTSG